MTRREPISVVCIFQRAPIWLPTLDKKMVDKIYLVGVDTFTCLTNHLKCNNCDVSLYNCVASNLGRQTFIFSTPPADYLYLVSGDITYLNDQQFLLRDKRCSS